MVDGARCDSAMRCCCGVHACMQVSDPEVMDKATQAIREFNAFILSDSRISLSILPVGDGVALCRKR